MGPNSISTFIDGRIDSQKKGFVSALIVFGLFLVAIVWWLFYSHEKEKQANRERDDQNRYRTDRLEAEMARLRVNGRQ